jgi:AcrR family transcriptional regulator
LRKENKNQKDQKEKERILNFIIQKFHKEGFYKTSMDEIAIGLKVSKKTLYKYFPSKDGLLEIICQKTINDISTSINNIILEEGDIITKFVKIINVYKSIVMNISDRWVNDLRIHSPNLTKSLEKYRSQKVAEILIKLLEKGKKEKLIENFPTSIVINTFNSTIFSLVHSDFVINNKFSLQEASRYTFELILNGLLTPKGREIYKRIKRETDKMQNFKNTI